MFRGFFRPVRASRNAPAPIKIDVTEDDKAYIVNAEIPGVKKDEIQVAIEGNQVTIARRSEARDARRKEGERVLRSERYTGSVYRSFTLPVRDRRDGQQREVRERRAGAHAREEARRAGRKLTIQ